MDTLWSFTHYHYLLFTLSFSRVVILINSFLYFHPIYELFKWLSLFCYEVLLFTDDIKFELKINSFSNYFNLNSELDTFCDWVNRVNFAFNIDKCHVISFFRSRSPLFHSYSLNYYLVDHVSVIKGLPRYLSHAHSLFWSQYQCAWSLKVKVQLGFTKRNTSVYFSSRFCFVSIISPWYVPFWNMG